MSKDALIKDLEKLREEIRPYDNGSGEGSYFADELDEVIQRHAAKMIRVGDLIRVGTIPDTEYRVTNIEVLRESGFDQLADFTITITGHRA